MVLENTFYITLGVRIEINFTFGVLNFLSNIKGIDKNKKQLIIIWMMIARKIIYNVFYRNEQFNEEYIVIACEENIKLIRIFRRENKLFMNQNMDFKQLHVLDYMCDILKEVIHISPKLSTVIRKYRKDENYLNDTVRGLTQKIMIGYKFFLSSGIN